MTRYLPALVLAAVLSASGAHGFEIPGIPVDFHFGLGFDIQVIPGPKDTSRLHCLAVATHKIISDKRTSLVVTGTITNWSSAPCECVEMHFAVDSYVGITTDFARAVITPDTIPPGGTATFNAHISLSSEKPKYARYTITARSPFGCGQERGAVAPEPETVYGEPPLDPPPQDSGTE